MPARSSCRWRDGWSRPLGDARARIRQFSQNLGWITLVTGRNPRCGSSWVPSTKGATALEQGTADFLLSFSHPRLPLLLDERSFPRVALGMDELVAVCAARTDGRPLHPLPGSARKPVPLLGYAPTLALAHILQDGLARASVDRHVRTIVESDFAESLHEQALRSAGWPGCRAHW